MRELSVLDFFEHRRCAIRHELYELDVAERVYFEWARDLEPFEADPQEVSA